MLLHVDIQFLWHTLLKRLSFSHCIFLTPLSKISCIHMDLFLFHWSMCFVLFFVFLASGILFGLLYTIGWNQEVWCIQLSSFSRFLWLFGVCVKNLHTDFRIFLYFCKRCHWHSMGITLNQYIALGSIDILTINLTMLI